MRARFLPIVLMLLILAGGLSGCGGGGGQATTAGRTSTGTATTPTENPEIAGVLDLFVQAAGRGDAEAMWGLLSDRSKAVLGTSLKGFQRKYARGFETGLGSFAGTGYDVLLSAVTPSGWGIAAIAGERTHDGNREYAAYAALLKREGNGWRLQLGDPVKLALLSPRGRSEDSQPVIAFRAQASSAIREAGLWLDGRPLPGTVSGSGTSIRVSGKPSGPLAAGRHVVIVFASTGGTATAGAAPFRIVGGGAPSA